jgi:hypothetical protein
MLKVIAASMVFALVVSGGAFGDVLGLIQHQQTQMGASNAINLLHGEQCASSNQNLLANNCQEIKGICDACAHQSLLGTTIQTASAQGLCALIGVAQELQVVGDQQQAVSQGVGPAQEAQGIGMTAGQSLARTDGLGMANATHVIVLNGGQGASNPATSMSENASVLGTQMSSVNGQPGSTALVQSQMSVVTTQTQGSV